MERIDKIIKAKLSDKTNMPDWYYKRLEKCLDCPLYSANFKPETIPEKVRYASLSAANLGKPFCLVCGCEAEAKASLPGSECPGKPQRWGKAIEGLETIADPEDYSITNSSTDKVAMSYSGAEIILNYGSIEYGSDTKVSLIISPKTEEDFINLKVSSDCGCTTPKLTRQGRDIKMDIEYDSKRIGDFNKYVSMMYTARRKNQIRVKITGTVKQI